MNACHFPLGCCASQRSTIHYIILALALIAQVQPTAGGLAQDVPKIGNHSFRAAPAQEWYSQVPLLLPSGDSQSALPEWSQISLVTRLNDEQAQGGWRPVSSGNAATLGSTVSPSAAARGQEIESAIAQLRGGSNSNQGVAPSGAPTSSAFSPADAETDPWVQTVLAEGQQLANGDRWSEALTIYQAALRKAPQSETLLKQRQTARTHVDLRNRLTDSKYVHFARTDSVEMAAAHLNEILLKIELNHIERPNWTGIFQHCLNSLLICFEDAEFQAKFVNSAKVDQIAGTVNRYRTSMNSVPVRSRAEFNGLARELANQAQRQIGLAPSFVLHEFAGTAASALDTYSTFLTPGHFDDLNSQIRGNFVGIGVELRSKKDHLEIVKAIPGGPADRARIRGGDKMLAINDQMITDVGGDVAADMLRGADGSQVTVVVETPEGKQYRLKMQRARVEIPSIEEVRLVNAAQGIGYIKLSNFQKNTPADFDRALMQLRQEGLRSLILDLRDNPGGSLDAAVEIVDRFIPRGTIVSTKGRNLAENMTYSAAQANYIGQLPLTVLINENSASASEILAAAIADHQRGTIIGQRSFGKGMVQTIFHLTSGRGGIRLTTAEYFGPSGRRVELQGVSPDLVVQTTARPDVESVTNTAESALSAPVTDEVLEAAIRRATNQLP